MFHVGKYSIHGASGLCIYSYDSTIQFQRPIRKSPIPFRQQRPGEITREFDPYPWELATIKSASNQAIHSASKRDKEHLGHMDLFE